MNRPLTFTRVIPGVYVNQETGVSVRRLPAGGWMVFRPAHTAVGDRPYAAMALLADARTRALRAAQEAREEIAAAYEEASREDVARATRIVHRSAEAAGVTTATLRHAWEMIDSARQSLDVGHYSRARAFGTAAVDAIWAGRDTSALLALATGKVATPPGLHVEAAEPAPDGGRQFKITAEQLADDAYMHSAYGEARATRSHRAAMIQAAAAVLAERFPGRRLVGCAPALVARAITEACPILSPHSHDEWTGEVVGERPAPDVFGVATGTRRYAPIPVPVGDLSPYPGIVNDVRARWNDRDLTSAEAVEELMDRLGVTNEGANALLCAVSVASLA